MYFFIFLSFVFLTSFSQAVVLPPWVMRNVDFQIDVGQSDTDNSSLDNRCRKKHLLDRVQLLSNLSINIYQRTLLLKSLLKSCGADKDSFEVFQSIIYHDHIEWALKKIVIKQFNHRCDQKVVGYLLHQLEQPTIDHHIREDFIWSLSDLLQERPITKENNCSGQVISFFSKLIQADQSDLTSEFMDFRTQKVLPILLSMVRLGIRNQVSLVGHELKAIALNHKVNDHFRVMAVEALQGLGAYSLFGVESLYQVIRDITVRLSKKTSLEMTDHELVQNQKDQKIRSYGLNSLAELASGSYFNFLNDVMGNREHLNAHTHQFYWRRSLMGLSVPTDRSHIKSVLKKASTDSVISACCGKFLKDLL